MAYQKATLLSNLMINKPTFWYVEKPKPTYHSAIFTKRIPLPPHSKISKIIISSIIALS